MTWQRLESSTVAADLVEGQEARIADPLWLLARQWQVGEFTGEDAASPILVEAELGHAPITRLRLGPPGAGGPVVERTGGGLPLETAVEREPVRRGPAAVRLAAEAGLQLWRLLDAAGAPDAVRAAIRRDFPLALPDDDGLDPLGRAQLELLARRSFDSSALYRRLTGPAGGRPAVPAARRRAVVAALREWAGWYAGLYSEPATEGPAWDPARMEYRFQVAAGVSTSREVQLDAREYPGGHLDWDAFDIADDEQADLGARGELSAHRLRVIPTPARFAGQAASRWWQLEDATVAFGDIAAAPEDLARVAVASFGAVFGDDWFLIPCRLPSGVIARVREVSVLDTFGEVHSVRSCAELDGPGRVWRFFELTGDTSADSSSLDDRRCPWLFLPPALPGVVESRPIEEVRFRRDEVANLAWAAEVRVESAGGRPVDRAARARAAAAPSPVAAEGAWLYRLATSVLEHQVPMVPVRSTADGGLYLQRGRMAVSSDASGVSTRGAVGRILEPDTALLVQDAEVPSTGMIVTRTWHMARTVDGGFVVWVGRTKSGSRSVRAPALVFDEVTQSAE